MCSGSQFAKLRGNRHRTNRPRAERVLSKFVVLGSSLFESVGDSIRDGLGVIVEPVPDAVLDVEDQHVSTSGSILHPWALDCYTFPGLFNFWSVSNRLTPAR